MKNKKFKVVFDGQAFEVEIHELGSDELQVTVNGEVHHMTVEEIQAESGAIISSKRVATKPRSATPMPVQKQAAPTHPGTLTAPMPGDIVAIEVKVGDTVEPGQPVCVLEAMKMKNILRASQHGRVAEIIVQLGQSVDYGAALVRFD